MFCMSCGVKLPSSAAFCPECGEKIESAGNAVKNGAPAASYLNEQREQECEKDEVQTVDANLSDYSASDAKGSGDDDLGDGDGDSSDAGELDGEEANDDNEEVVATLDYDDHTGQVYHCQLVLTNERLYGPISRLVITEDGSIKTGIKDCDIPLADVESILFVDRNKTPEAIGSIIGVGINMTVVAGVLLLFWPKFSAITLRESWPMLLFFCYLIISCVSSIRKLPKYIARTHQYFILLKKSDDEILIPVPRQACDDARDFIAQVENVMTDTCEE